MDTRQPAGQSTHKQSFTLPTLEEATELVAEFRDIKHMAAQLEVRRAAFRRRLIELRERGIRPYQLAQLLGVSRQRMNELLHRDGRRSGR